MIKLRMTFSCRSPADLDATRIDLGRILQLAQQLDTVGRLIECPSCFSAAFRCCSELRFAFGRRPIGSPAVSDSSKPSSAASNSDPAAPLPAVCTTASNRAAVATTPAERIVTARPTAGGCAAPFESFRPQLLGLPQQFPPNKLTALHIAAIERDL